MKERRSPRFVFGIGWTPFEHTLVDHGNAGKYKHGSHSHSSHKTRESPVAP